MFSSELCALLVLAASVTAQMTTSTTSASSSASAAPTAVTGCHSHGDEGFFCIAGSEEWEVTSPELTAETLPDGFEGCHSHGEDLHCTGGDTEATLEPAGSESAHDHDHAETVSETSAPTSTSPIATRNGTATSTTSATATSSALPTAVDSCHTHSDTELFCLDGSDEWQVTSDWDQNDPPESFENCHSHGQDLHCVDGDDDATLVKATESHGDTEEGTTSSSTSGTNSADASSTSSADASSTSSADASDVEESSSAASNPQVTSGAGLLAAAMFAVYALVAF